MKASANFLTAKVEQLYKTRQHFVCTPELSTETLESSDD